jgi:cytochrome c556
MKPLHLSPLLIAGVLVCAPAAAQFQTAEVAIKYRQGAFSVMAAHFTRIAMMAQGIHPYDAKAVAENAELVASMSRLPFSAFGPGTDKGGPTRAKPEIWKEPVKFKSASDRMVADAARLDAAAKSGNFDAIKAAVGVVGQGCKACHDDFRGQTHE